MTQELPRSSCRDFEEVRPKHVALITRDNASKSIRDYGGLYIVHGKYSLDAAVEMKATRLSMIDGNITPEFKFKIEEARRHVPGLEVELVNTDFRLPALYEVLRPVDTSLLFNVLMHQENYISIIGGVCRTTRKFICVAQPNFKETAFSVPGSATLLQFWPEELKRRFRQGAYWPENETPATFDPICWMWGHTTSHLIACFQGFGWKLDHGEIVEDVLGPHWDYPLLRFCPA